MTDVYELITEALHGLPVEAPIGSLNGRDTRKIADVLVAELGLHVEGRQLSDGEGGSSTNWKTGETTSYSKPCTLQTRWVTAWVKDDGMTLPLAAYSPTP